MDVQRSLLAAWADVAPSAEPAAPLQVAKPEDVLWLGTSWSLFAQHLTTTRIPRSAVGSRLAQLDALNQDTHVLREGWVFLSGTVARDGVDQPVLMPLISRPVRLASESLSRVTTRVLGAANVGLDLQPSMVLRADGEADLIPLIDDLDLRADLLERAEFGRGAFTESAASAALLRRMPALSKWVEDVVVHAGLAPGRIPMDATSPTESTASVRGLRALVGGAVYAANEMPRPVAAAALKAWSQVESISATSFGTLYPDPSRAQDDHASVPTDPHAAVLSPFVLSPSQERVVTAARTRPLTVVSGAPGNGKTHAVAAVALDHVARGQSVLVATRSRFAARSIADLIHRVPGPNALRFGDIIEGSSVVDELNDHLLDAPATDAAGDLVRARAARDAAAATVRSALELEVLAADAPSSIAAMRITAPRCFDLGSDLDELARLAADAGRPRSGPFSAWRRQRAVGRLSEAVGASVTDTDAVVGAIGHARRRRAAIVLAADGGTVLADAWDRLGGAKTPSTWR